MLSLVNLILFSAIAQAKDAVFVPLGKTAEGAQISAGFKDVDEIKLMFVAQLVAFLIWLVKSAIDSWKHRNNKDSERLEKVMSAVDRIEQRIVHLEKKPDESHVRDLIRREIDWIMKRP